jgi:type I restriction enzyme S subunit
LTEIMTLYKPQGWNLRRFDHLFDERKEKVSDKDFPPLSITMNGIVPQLDTVAKTDDGDNRKLVRAGDYVINSRSDRKGSGGISEYDGSVSLIGIILKPKGIFPRFAHHLLRSQVFQEEFYRWGHGIVGDLWTTRFADTKNIYCFLPNPATQKAIAAFLDRETSRIDELIAKKQRQLELLQEKRTVLISHVVTKGLDPDVRMKDSGVEWLGEIPEHWEVARFKYALWLQRGHDLPTAEFCEGEYPVCGSNGCIGYHSLFTTRGPGVTVGRSGSVGEINYIDTDYWAHNTALYVKEFRQLIPRYSYYLLKSLDVKYLSEGTAVGTLNRNYIHELRIPVPTIAQQQSIAAFLDQETSRIDELIAKVSKSIDLLREYRVALISAAVTGKIDVREEVA